MTTVVDASTVVAFLVDDGPDGEWATRIIRHAERLAAPQLLHAEVANILRRAELSASLPEAVPSLAYADLLDLPVDLHPYEPLARRVWELRPNVTAYDAWYVALAEALETPLATLDLRLSAAPGARCDFVTPPQL